jgi:hypothetical protein
VVPSDTIQALASPQLLTQRHTSRTLFRRAILRRIQRTAGHPRTHPRCPLFCHRFFHSLALSICWRHSMPSVHLPSDLLWLVRVESPCTRTPLSSSLLHKQVTPQAEPERPIPSLVLVTLMTKGALMSIALKELRYVYGTKPSPRASLFIQTPFCHRNMPRTEPAPLTIK